MLNRAALFATMIAGTALSGALLLGQTPSSAAEPVQAAPEPTPVLEHAAAGWHLLHEGDRAKLAYGIANSDQILVMLSCAAGDETVEVFGLAAPEADEVVLTSASLRSPLPVEPTIDPISGATAIETTLPVEAEALEGFRATGRLTLTADTGESVPAHAMQAELPQVQAFFDHCQRRSI